MHPFSFLLSSFADETATFDGDVFRVSGDGATDAWVEVAYTGGDTDTRIKPMIQTSIDGVTWFIALGGEYLTSSGRELVTQDPVPLLTYVRLRVEVTGTAPTSIDGQVAIGSATRLVAEVVEA